ncbi:hypothetical protein Dsin_020367 [Dipteronia sinensis]|uniref:Uncharacterized protein n=1 Tax=Dipteronia sinensis TaxID=43782 RepID=A0AAE0E3X9_9ROSI|nr:hypothetical protein Dsin_020367 [Dipteronia sinensis]
MSRFREALFYFSAVFDMFEANAGRESWETMLLIEEDEYAGEIMNAIAREGTKRIERAETFKLWQVQNLMAQVEKVKAAHFFANGLEACMDGSGMESKTFFTLLK